MAYSRFSQVSDVYAYQSMTGKFHVYTACNRDGKELELPMACKEFVLDTLKDMQTQLLELQELGYRMTKHTFTRIEVELAI